MNKGRWTEEEIQYLKDNLRKLRLWEIAINLNRKLKSVQHKTFNSGLSSQEDFIKSTKDRSGITVDENFFETPNLINSYWAGFIAADGNIRKKGENVLNIQLSSKDINHLRQFMSDIKFNGKLTEYIRTNIKGTFGYCNMSIVCKKICDDLKKNFNITCEKTYTLKPPILNKNEFNYAYIIGYIDGDGSISYDPKRDRLCLSFVGQENVLCWFLSVLNDIENTNNYDFKTIKIKNQGKFGEVSVNNKKLYKTLQYLKTLDVPKLDRKWNKVDLNKKIVYMKNYNKQSLKDE